MMKSIDPTGELWTWREVKTFLIEAWQLLPIWLWHPSELKERINLVSSGNGSHLQNYSHVVVRNSRENGILLFLNIIRFILTCSIVFNIMSSMSVGTRFFACVVVGGIVQAANGALTKRRIKSIVKEITALALVLCIALVEIVKYFVSRLKVSQAGDLQNELQSNSKRVSNPEWA